MKKKQEILDLVNSDNPVLLHFYMTDCQKQKGTKATLRRLQKTQKENKIEIVNIEINKQPLLAQELEIEAVPIVLLYASGQEHWRKGGMVSEAQILHALELLNKIY